VRTACVNGRVNKVAVEGQRCEENTSADTGTR